jgi:anti-repressor protein
MKTQLSGAILPESVQIFNNDQLGEIRVIVQENGEPLFCLADLCRALNLTNPSMVAQKLDEDERPKLDLGRQGETTFVTESGLYTIILRSDSPMAKPMQKWVTSEVLPAIRKHGAYITPTKIEQILSDPDTLIQLVTNYKKERDERLRIEAENNANKQALKAAEPKVLFADAVTASESSILVGEMAKILKQNGIEIGQNRLFIWLREHGYLCSRGEAYNQPTQKAMELGLFEIKKTTIQQPDGTVFVTVTTKVSPKGQIYFVNKFLSAQHENQPKQPIA